MTSGGSEREERIGELELTVNVERHLPHDRLPLLLSRMMLLCLFQPRRWWNRVIVSSDVKRRAEGDAKRSNSRGQGKQEIGTGTGRSEG